MDRSDSYILAIVIPSWLALMASIALVIRT